MNSTIEILRGELERLFSLEELTSMSERLLGLDPLAVGGNSAKATFARALTERCLAEDRLEALVDVLLATRKSVDPRVRDAAAQRRAEDIEGGELGDFEIVRKLGENPLFVEYLAARREGATRVLKVLRADAACELRAVQRFLTANRMVAAIDAPGLPLNLEVGQTGGKYWVSYDWFEAQSLAARFARSGPSHINELKPVLRGILEPLAAMHAARVAHGDLKLENVLLGRASGGNPQVTLIDFATDRLRQRPIVTNGHSGILAVFGSPRTIAPEQVRGMRAEPATDVYAFGAMLYELLSGKPVFTYESATDAAVSHLTRAPEPPSGKAPRGWVTRDVDQFVLSLLAKEPERRPRDAGVLLEALGSLGRGPASIAPPGRTFSEEKLSSLMDALIADPEDADAAAELENAIEEGADPAAVADAFEVAAAGVVGEDDAATGVKAGLLARAARTFDTAAADNARAEKAYVSLLQLEPSNRQAQIALEVVRKALGKYSEVVESLIARSETAAPGEERARIFAEIGRLCSTELEDPDQGILAYGSALCETPLKRDLAEEIEHLAEGKATLWNEVLATITAAIQGDSLSTVERSKLLAYAARWYDEKLGRGDLAVMAYEQMLAADAGDDDAHEGLIAVYRKSKQWPELTQALLARAEAAEGAPRARDLRAEAAEVLELHLNDAAKAQQLYEQVLSDDPGHVKAAAGMARIAERTGDTKTLAAVLARRAQAQSGRDKATTLVKLGEVYEHQIEDLGEAARQYEAALAAHPDEPQALKGLDRIYNRTGRYRELLDNLQRQSEGAATPRQKINLLERMAALYEEEFLDHARAAEQLEQVLAIDSVNESALGKLPAHYRALGRWEPLEELYEKHAELVADPRRRVELLVQRARVLVDHIGSPERATRAYERVLELEPGHAGALEALARLREQTGDAQAALEAIEALATKSATPEGRAEQWLRAARLLETRGDRDGAIERYKLAIEANPNDAAASAALRRAYAARGDAASVVSLIERELEMAEGRLARARLQAELARVLRDQMHDPELAEANAKTAIELDPTNADALLVLGDIAYERERYVEASKHLEPLVARAAALPKNDAVRAIVRFVEAYGRTVAPPSGSPVSERGQQGSMIESQPRLAAAVAALERVAPDDAPAKARVARVMFDANDMVAARRMYDELLVRHVTDLSNEDRAQAQWRLGEALRRSGELDKAVDLLREAAEADPESADPLNALARVYEQTGDWEEFVRTKSRRLEMAAGNERFELLMEIGDAEFKKLSDRKRASKTYLAALEERPHDRKLLTKLMELFSEEKDWGSLVEVVLRLANFVDDPKQRAKYMHTAAKVSARQMGDVDRALEYYGRTLEFDPTLMKAMDEAIELHRQKGDNDAVEELLNKQLEHAKQVQDAAQIVRVLDRLGELYRKYLNEPELAIDAYEAAQAFDPEGKERMETLAELYASDVGNYLDKAVSAQAIILRENPYRTESYKLLRRLYTEARKPDPAWCLCQALTVLALADPDEQRFYTRHRGESPAPAQAMLEEPDWATRIAHEDADPLVTNIFALIQPTIVFARTSPLQALGYDPAYRIDLASQPYPVCQMLYYVQGVFGFEAPAVFQNPNDPGGLGFLHAHTPSIVLGASAFAEDIPAQSLAFVTGRHVAYFRPGYYVRHLVPTGTGLKGWLFAAIKLCVPQFPIAQEVQGQVNEALGHLSRDFTGVQRELLASLVSKLLQSGGAIDLKKWVAAIDLTADRAGFLVAHDLAIATDVIRATEDASSVSSKDRVKEAVLYSISAPYLELREKLLITIDS
jgi:tetratricopeptide (TPR) repeat protein